MILKKTLFALLLNLLFGGLGYLYIKERKPLAYFLIFATAYEFIRNLMIGYDTALRGDPYAYHTLPLLSLLGSIPGFILLALMGVDIYFLVKRQYKKT